MDLEGRAKRLILKKDSEAARKLADGMKEYKDLSDAEAFALAGAVLEETKAALALKGDIFNYEKSGVGMGRFGVGSRGAGDFYVHEKIGKVIGKTSAVLDSSNLDDSGVVGIDNNCDENNDKNENNELLVLTVDGIHSRLSAFPFLAGFHAAKAALRDIYVMGAKPAAMLSDIHVADDGDVAMIFDHIAGITAVSELTGIPLITGSTLRIGGDMVIGERMTGCVGAVGTVNARGLTARNKATPGDLILMTEGAGGGTVTTAAIYSGYAKAEEVVEKTLNVDFLTACQAILDSPGRLHTKIHVMTDVTNGGVRGDAYEISKEANVRLVFDDAALKNCVEPSAGEMFEALGIDFRGVSIDSLLVICPEEIAAPVIQTAGSAGVKMYITGRVEEKAPNKFDTALVVAGEEKEFKPMFREAAYTPLKKAIGEKEPTDFEAMKKEIDAAAAAAVEKRERTVQRIKEKTDNG
ncbi:MAG: AIR synthase-related protein [Methanimicrococcus sp.]|nr:AIR synthase-related protein [Methanimicrococcus sp.]